MFSARMLFTPSTQGPDCLLFVNLQESQHRAGSKRNRLHWPHSRPKIMLCWHRPTASAAGMNRCLPHSPPDGKAQRYRIEAITEPLGGLGQFFVRHKSTPEGWSDRLTPGSLFTKPTSRPTVFYHAARYPTHLRYAVSRPQQGCVVTIRG